MVFGVRQMGLNRVTSLDNYLESIHAVMYNSLGSYYIVDTQRRVLYANKDQIYQLGFSSADELIGRTVEGTVNERFESLCQSNDRLVRNSGKEKIFTECAINPNNKLRIVTSYKRPFYHQDKLIGIEGRSLEVDLNLLALNTQLTEHTFFVDIKDQKIMNLTRSKRRVLFFALKGYTAADIANILSLSKRTVQNHLAYIKDNSQYATLKELLLNTVAL
jgi:hypothetical protein